jgi:hypothetical protein
MSLFSPWQGNLEIPDISITFNDLMIILVNFDLK